MDDSVRDKPWTELDPALNVLSQRVIGAAIEVHRELGAGLDEALYEAALAREFALRGIRYERQVIVPVVYKGEIIGDRRLDFLVEQLIVVELKAVSEIAPIHPAQVKTYLVITGLQLGLLINFNVTVLKDGIKRVIRQH